MDPIYKDKLRKNRVAIVEHMQEVETIIDNLLQAKVVTMEFAEKIKSIRVRADQVREILDYIPAKIRGYPVFLEALRLSGNDGVLMALGEEPGDSNSPEEEKQETPQSQPRMKQYVKDKLVIPPVSAAAAQRNVNLCYSMTKKSRGNVLLLEVRNFADDSTRRGSEHDRDAVDELFTKLHFNVNTTSDPTAAEMTDAVAKFSSPACHNNSDCVIVVAMSHGKLNQIIAYDNKPVKIQEEIIDPIISCPAYKDKPKIFIFQTCRVKENETDSDSPTDTMVVQENLTIREPTGEHTIVAWATVEGEKAFRRTWSGSWFIQALVSVFSDYAHKEDVLSMLTMVNSVVGDQVADSGRKQVCKMESTLKKKIFFNPGYSE